jgi:hypothetical protein
MAKPELIARQSRRPSGWLGEIRSDEHSLGRSRFALTQARLSGAA